MPIAEHVRKTSISKQTFCCWQKHDDGLESDEVCELKEFREENTQLKSRLIVIRL